MPTGIYDRTKAAPRRKERLCRVCKEMFPNTSEFIKHSYNAHGHGGTKTPKKVETKKPTKLTKPIRNLRGANYDTGTPWNLGLVDALNMARKSIERSLEIIEGNAK